MTEIKTRSIRKKFTKEEDGLLTELVKSAKVDKALDIDWQIIAEAMGNGRTGRQCRERWEYHLMDTVDNIKKRWSKQEENKLCELVNIHGGRWKKIAQMLPFNRSPNALKDRWIKLQKNKELDKESLGLVDLNSEMNSLLEQEFELLK